jgi:hypothetical protein
MLEHAAFFNTQGRYGNRFHKWAAGLVPVGAIAGAVSSQRADHVRFGHGVTRTMGPLALDVEETD